MVIDSDYYNNPDNEGHIMFAILPFVKGVTFKKGDRIGQGVIERYYLTDDDAAEGERLGGFGSTSDEDLSGRFLNNGVPVGAVWSIAALGAEEPTQ